MAWPEERVGPNVKPASPNVMHGEIYTSIVFIMRFN
jgi:hypothetical protein